MNFARTQSKVNIYHILLPRGEKLRFNVAPKGPITKDGEFFFTTSEEEGKKSCSKEYRSSVQIQDQTNKKSLD
jgi:hypothetical protein